MTRSLKHALQPSLSNVTVSFDIPVADCDITQAPRPLPPVFDGDKLVAYGIVTPKSPPQGVVSATAVLKGSLLGEEVVHTVPFDIDFSAISSSSFMPVHSMAGKALLHDMEQARVSGNDLVRMSKETGVLCKETAFVAVDEVGMTLQEPLQAPLVSYDLMSQVASVKTAMACNIDRALERGERLDDLQLQSESLGTNAKVFQKASQSYSAKRGYKSVMSSVSGWFYDMVSSSGSSSNKESDARQAPIVSPQINDCLDECYSSDSDSCEEFKEAGRVLPESLPRSTADLPSIVLAQQANGAWSPEGAAKAVGKPVSELSRACPGGCDGTVWATAVVLAVLGSRYGTQKDEWELVVRKATAWIQRQALPDTVTIDSLHAAAEQFLKQ